MSTHACFSNFRALLILNGYLYCAQMERAQNSDSETHVENLNQTSRTDLSRKSLSYIFLGHPVHLHCMKYGYVPAQPARKMVLFLTQPIFPASYFIALQCPALRASHSDASSVLPA